MADGGLKIELDEGLADRLKAAAEAVGRPADEYAAELISRGLEDRWSESLARLADYDRTGEYIDADVALADFRAELERRLSQR